MKKPYSYLLLAFILMSITSCSDILEEDISKDNMQIIYPTHGTVIEGNTVQFSWQSLKGAENYRIQLITNNQVYVLDSLVSPNNFVYSLNPGEYQWRVLGKNFAYETPYTFPASFTVKASDNLENQMIVLKTPNDKLYTKKTNITFIWSRINSADYYNLEIIKNLNGQQSVFVQDSITTTMFTLPTNVLDKEDDAEYFWKIKAFNSISQTKYFQRSIFIDRVAPNQPALVSPANGDISASTVNFNWTNGTDTGNVKSVITNTIEISKDPNFGSILDTSKTVNNSYQYIFKDPGVYHWRVRAEDSAENVSDNSAPRSVNIE